jgi:hypothetical protein
MTTPIQTTATATGLCAGTYSVVVVNGSGCTGVNTVTITQPSQISIVTTGQNPSSCTSCNGMVSASVLGGTPPYTYMWSPGTCNTITCTGLCAGTYTLVVTDANGCTATATRTLTCLTTDVEDIAMANTVSVYPNPSNGIFILETDAQKSGIEIYNIVGSLVYKDEIKSGKTELDLSMYEKGIYFVRLEINGDVKTQKLIVN